MRQFLISCAVLCCLAGNIYSGELHSAAQRGDLDAVKQALATNPASINELDPGSGGTPLLLAAISGNMDVVAFLVENGAEINLASQGVTPLHGAAYRGHKDIALYLIAGGANMKAKTLNGLTPLEWAEKQGHSDLVESLRKAAEVKQTEVKSTPPPQRLPEPQPVEIKQPETTTSRTHETLIAELTAEIETLADRLEESEEKRNEIEKASEEELEKLRQAKNDEITELELIITEIEQSLADEREAAQAAAGMERRLSILQRRLKIADDRRMDIEERYKANIRGIEAARDQTIADLKDEIKKLKTSEKQLRDDYELSKKEASNLRRQLDKLKTNLEEADERYAQLQQTYDAGIEAVQRSRDKTVAEMNQKLAEAHKSEADLKAANIEKEFEIAELKEKITGLEDNLAEARTIKPPDPEEFAATVELRGKIIALEKELDQAKTEKNKLLNELESTRTEYSKFINESAEAIKAMQASAAGRETALEARLKNMEAALTNDSHDIENQTKELKDRISELEDRLASATEESARARQEKEQALKAKADIEQNLKFEIASKNRLIDSLLEKIRETEKRIAEIEAGETQEQNTAPATEDKAGEVVEIGSRIVQLAMKMKETILADENGTNPEFQSTRNNQTPGQEFGAEILYKQNVANGEITDFQATLVETDTNRADETAVPDQKTAPVISAAVATPETETIPTNTPAPEKRDNPPLQPDTADSQTAFATTMHVHSSISSGRYTLPEITELAVENDIDVIFLSDSLAESIQYGLFPLRHIFWLNKHLPSVTQTGPDRYLAAIRAENERQKEVLYVPGVEIVPRFFWTGSLLKQNLVCHNHQRNIIALGTERESLLRTMPITCGFLKGRDTLLVVLTRVALGFFVLACIATVTLARPLARRAGYPAAEIVKSFCLGLVLPSILIMALVNIAVSFNPEHDIYSPDNPSGFEQRVIDRLNEQSIPHFWAHPEATDNHEFNYLGMGFKVNTQPYPGILVETSGYTGFGGVNEGKNELIEPGAGWDKVLKEYNSEIRQYPVWCFGEMLYHYEGQAGKKLGNVETVIWAEEKSQNALLAAVRKGRFYARQNSDGRKLIIESWRVKKTDPLEITLRVSSTISGEQVEVQLVKDGYIMHESKETTPFELKLEDKPPESDRSYYRAIIKGSRPLRAVSNPIFIN